MKEGSYSEHDIGNLQVIIGFCEDIEYLVKLHGSDEMDFKDNISLQYSCVFSIIQIGEHIKRLSLKLKDEHPEIDWKGVAGLRDKIVHRYGNIDISWVRHSVLNDVPFLENVCRNILKSYLMC